jgi:hypothetical protein
VSEYRVNAVITTPVLGIYASDDFWRPNLVRKQVQMPSSAFEINEEVNTAYGDGVITKYREEDEIYEILLKKWILATKKSPILFAKGENITKKPSLFESAIKRAFENKKLGAELYSKGSYEKAAEKYYECMNVYCYINMHTFFVFVFFFA